MDDGYSGSDPHRPDWRKVYELAEGHEINLVLATKRDRFFRSRLHRLLAERDLGEMGVRMVALDDTSNKLADDFLDSFAEFEREQIKERTMRGLAQKARSGKVIRSSWKPYGFVFTDDGCGLAVHPGEMRVVVRLFEGLAEGRTGRSITDGFEAEGILSPSGLDRWNQRTVTNILRSGLYRPVGAPEVAPKVSPEVAASLHPEGSYGLWTYAKSETSRRREWDPERGKFVTRHAKKPRPEGEHLIVPVPLEGSGLDRATVDAAREQATNRARRPSTAGGRYWTLKGVLRCQECGCSISPHTVKRRLKDGSPGKDSFYYQCRQKYHDGPRECGNITNFPAAPLEQAVWEEVHDLIANPHRLQKAYAEERERRANAHRNDPGKEVRTLAEEMARLEARRSNLIDLAADNTISREDLRAKLTETEARRKKVEEALREAGDRRDGMDALRRELDYLFLRFDQIRTEELRFLHPEDRRHILMASRTTAEIDRKGNVKITGMLNLDVTKLLPTAGAYRTEHGAANLPPHKGVVARGSTPSPSSA